MKQTFLGLIFIPILVFTSCNTTKKATITTPVSSPNTTSSAPPFPLSQPVDGSPAPGDDALAAIQKQYSDATLEQLKEGHAIFTTGACINCHGVSNIHQYEQAQWKSILEDMTQRAYLSNTQKDAVTKYVLAIKAMPSK